MTKAYSKQNASKRLSPHFLPVSNAAATDKIHRPDFSFFARAGWFDANCWVLLDDRIDFGLSHSPSLQAPFPRLSPATYFCR